MRRESREPIQVTEAELAVLRSLWRKQPATVRELADHLYPGGETSHYATVQKLLDRLQAKGCVERRKEGRANVFTALVDRGRLIRDRLRLVADQFTDGALAPLLSHLVSGADLSQDDLQDLRTMVDGLDGRSASESQAKDSREGDHV